MADFTPVALGIKAPEGMSLGEMANIARSAQMYRQAEQTNPLALEQAQETTKQSKLKTETDQMALLQKKFKHIADSQISMINNPLIVAAEKDPQSVDPAKLADLVKKNGHRTAKALGIAPEQADELLAPYMEIATTSPGELRQYYKERHIQGLDEGSRTSALGASGINVNTGTTGYTVQTGEFGPQKPGTIVAGTGYNAQVAPGSQETLDTDPLTGNKVVVTKDASGKIISSRAAPAAPAAGGFNAVPAGESAATAEAAKAIQLQANKAAMNVQQSQFNTNTIIGLADKALVGSNAETLAKLGGGFAVVPWSSDATDNRQKLGHQIALETANLAAGAGLNTDAARALGEKMSGTTEWTPEAIKSTARMNRALTTGTDMFNRGVNAAVEKAGNSPFAAREFQNKWSTQEQLVPTLQFVDALRNAKADPVGAQKAIQSVGGYGSDGYKDMLKRAGKLNELITKGQ
jgi:hypothetical protein